MWVVKVGGSLMSSPYLQDWLNAIAEQGRGKIIIVPGGGLFADQVRRAQHELQFDDKTAHKMALRAMEQYGLLLQDMESRLAPARSESEINSLSLSKNIPIWFPYNMVAENIGIQSSWDITSDSLALWLAERLGCNRLVLVKSTVPENNNYCADDLSRQGYLDKAFAEAFSKNCVNTIWLSHNQLDLFLSVLDKETSLSEMQVY